MPSHRTKKKYDFLVRCLLIGNSGVGKSCLLLRFAEDSFSTALMRTIGIDFKIKTIQVNGKRVKIQVWDTAGQEQFRTITTAYYRGAMGILLVYDVTDFDSFQKVLYWMRHIKQNAGSDVNIILVGNKSDQTDLREVDQIDGQALATQYSIRFYETSAKANVNVSECFLELVEAIVTRLATTCPRTSSDANPAIDLNAPQKYETCC